jgi:hypothetical protein
MRVHIHLKEFELLATRLAAAPHTSIVEAIEDAAFNKEADGSYSYYLKGGWLVATVQGSGLLFTYTGEEQVISLFTSEVSELVDWLINLIPYSASELRGYLNAEWEETVRMLKASGWEVV